MAPDRVAMALEVIHLYQEGEGLRQADRTGDIEPCAIWRDVSDHAVDGAAAVKGEHAVFEHSVPWRFPFLIHRC